MHRIINLKVNHFKVSILGLLVLLGMNEAQVDKVQVVLPQVSRQAKDLSRVVRSRKGRTSILQVDV